MARKGLIESNNRKNQMVQRYQNKRDNLRSLIYDKNLPLEERFGFVLKLAKCPRNSSKVRVRSRCVVSGRSRGVYQKFALSRIAFRDLALSGCLPGVKKSSW